ncbi:hypothetical protein [Sodalis sp.]|uniref:hypothetical protein n=1 Tax=Sodalis sp. (in: enterobacteria) TaxID=1898979 RepID=UPI003872D50F
MLPLQLTNALPDLLASDLGMLIIIGNWPPAQSNCRRFSAARLYFVGGNARG